MENLICPACQNDQVKIDFKLKIRFIDDSDYSMLICDLCTHRFLKLTPEQMLKVESVYSHSYKGHRLDEKATLAFTNFMMENVNGESEQGILDVGCGSGEFLQKAKEFGITGKGIDISEEGIGECRKKGVNGVKGNFLKYEFSEKFRMITFWDVLEHLDRPLQFMKRAYDLLGKNGVVLAKIPFYNNLDFRFIKINNRLATILLGAPVHMQFFRSDSIEKIGRTAGFSKCIVQKIGDLRTPINKGIVHKIKKTAIKSIRNISGDGNFLVVFEKS